jgi:SAM-dependent methyltransferase
MTSQPKQIQPAYSFISQVYDDIMAEIDYEYWADYIDGIIQEIKPDTQKILELASGTGTLAYSLNELGCYSILATDLNTEMVAIAISKKEKLASYPDHINFEVKDASNFTVLEEVDAIICVFDSLNYLTTEQQVKGFFKHSYDALKDQGLLLFDFITEKHCIENATDFAFEESFHKDYRIVREATYPNENRLHSTSFNVYKGANSLDLMAKEIHIQKPYSLTYILDILSQYNFKISGVFGDFTDQSPTLNTKRITLAATCLKNL